MTTPAYAKIVALCKNTEINENVKDVHEILGIDFATAVLAFNDDCLVNFQQATALLLPTAQWLDQFAQITEQGQNFAVGYLSGFHRIEDSWNTMEIESGSDFEQILQTTTLLLSKLANPNTDDLEMQNLFEQLPDFNEIVASLPMLVSTLGFFALQVKNDE
ncbi:MAG: YecA family protein [Psychromonas sp.]